MGLAPYGDYERIRGILSPWHPIFKDGELITPHDYGQPYFFNETGATQYHFDESSKIRPIIDQHGPEHVAAEAQRVLEEQMFQIILPWAEKTKNDCLSCAGGIFLNVKLNQRIWETSRFPHQHIFPNAGDSGLAVGAALLAYYQQHPKADFHPLEHLYFGNQWSHADIVAALQLRKVPWRQVPDPARFAAEQLANDKIVAWFQGRMESGPRALGNRSILMSANKRENKDIINAQVKFREAFRPFCPSILWEKKEDYLEHPRDEFFMITSFTCKPNKRDKVPAVVHADHTLRPQTVKKDFNPRYWQLINHFGQITGEYLVLNTSFNLMGEAIISTPRDAIKCFFDNGIDTLVMDDIVLEKARLHSPQ
jgi:carbamoyltransferase